MREEQQIIDMSATPAPQRKPQSDTSMGLDTSPVAPPTPPPPSGDLGLLATPPPPPPPPMETGLAQFVNDIRDIIPPVLKKTSWAYTMNLVGLAAYSPRLAEALRHRFKEYVQYLKMSYPRHQITPEFSLWLNNLRLLGVIQTSRATRPDTERKLLTMQTSEVISSPAKTSRKKFLGLL